MSYTPDKDMIEKARIETVSHASRRSRPDPLLVDAGKYFTNLSDHGWTVDAIMSEAALLRQYELLMCDYGQFGFSDYNRMVNEISLRSDKLLLIMISDVKNTIDILTGNTSNISYLFYRGHATEISNFEYRLPIIEAKMEKPLLHNAYIDVYWDLLQKLEAHLDTKVGKSNKHKWIVQHLSFEREKDDAPESNKLRAFYKVRDERIRQEASKKEKPKLSDEEKEQLANLQRSLTVLSKMVADVTKSVADLAENI